MRTVSIFALLFLFQSLAVCQEQEQKPEVDTDSKLYIPFVCNVDDVHVYDVTDTKYKNGEVRTAVKRQLTLKVLSVDVDEVVIAMSSVSQASEASRKRFEVDPIAKEIREIWDSFVLKVGVTRNGVFGEVKNKDEFEALMDKHRALVTKMADRIRQGMEQRGEDPTQIKRLIATVMQEAGSNESALGELVAPLNLLIQLVDTEHEMGKPQVDKTLVDLRPATDIPATETYRSVKVDRDSGSAIVQFQRRIEGEQATTKYFKALEAFVQKMNPNRKPPRIPKVTVLSDTLVEGNMDLKTGWPHSISWTDKFNNLRDDQLLPKRKIELQRVEAKK